MGDKLDTFNESDCSIYLTFLAFPCPSLALDTRQPSPFQDPLLRPTASALEVIEDHQLLFGPPLLVNPRACRLDGPVRDRGRPHQRDHRERAYRSCRARDRPFQGVRVFRWTEDLYFRIQGCRKKDDLIPI